MNPHDRAKVRSVYFRLLQEDDALVKFTVDRYDPVASSGWYDMPSKTEFDAELTRVGIRFKHDEPQRHETPGIVFDVYRYTLIEDGG